MIRKVAVLGAGTMGAQIAGHMANAGLSVLLLDVTREQARAPDGRGARRASTTADAPLDDRMEP